MKNAFLRTGYTCATLLAGALLASISLLAAPVNAITVTLPHDVTVGSTELPAGHYTITSAEMGGEDLFVLRGEHTAPVTVRGVRTESDSDKTEVTLSKTGDTWRLEKLNIAGEGEAFQFLNTK
jgi:hypothetical protein